MRDLKGPLKATCSFQPQARWDMSFLGRNNSLIPVLPQPSPCLLSQELPKACLGSRCFSLWNPFYPLISFLQKGNVRGKASSR